LFSEFQTGYLWHVMVQDQTRQTLHFSLLELGCGSESLDRMTDNLQHELQRVPYRVVIIKNGTVR
jgi:hypothetical protein